MNSKFNIELYWLALNNNTETSEITFKKSFIREDELDPVFDNMREYYKHLTNTDTYPTTIKIHPQGY